MRHDLCRKHVRAQVKEFRISCAMISFFGIVPPILALSGRKITFPAIMLILSLCTWLLADQSFLYLATLFEPELEQGCLCLYSQSCGISIKTTLVIGAVAYAVTGVLLVVSSALDLVDGFRETRSTVLIVAGFIGLACAIPVAYKALDILAHPVTDIRESGCDINEYSRVIAGRCGLQRCSIWHGTYDSWCWGCLYTCIHWPGCCDHFTFSDQLARKIAHHERVKVIEQPSCRRCPSGCCCLAVVAV